MEATELQGKLKGIYTVLITPFKENFEIDIQGFRENIDYCIKAGVHGVLVGGSLGEFSSLTFEERCTIIKEATDVANGRVPVINSTAHSCLKDAIELNNYSESVGADGVMMTAPYYSNPSEEGIYKFFEEVVKETDLGIVLYNTFRAGVNLTPKFIGELANLPNIVGLKQGTRNSTEQFDTADLLSDKIAVLSGSEEVMLQNYSIGMVGTTAVSSGFMPQVFLDIYNDVQIGNYEKARDLVLKLGDYHRLVRELGQPIVAKEAMRLLGLAAGPLRPPMVVKDSVKLESLTGILRDIGFEIKVKV